MVVLQSLHTLRKIVSNLVANAFCQIASACLRNNEARIEVVNVELPIPDMQPCTSVQFAIYMGWMTGSTPFSFVVEPAS